MRDVTCCCIGPAQLYASEIPELNLWLGQTIEQLRKKHGVKYFGVGGNRGFEMMAANTILSLRQRYPDIRLILVLPCPEYASKWREDDRRSISGIISQASKIVYASKSYTPTCMAMRDKRLIDYSGTLITHSDKSTATAVAYAKKMDVEVIQFVREPS